MREVGPPWHELIWTIVKDDRLLSEAPPTDSDPHLKRIAVDDDGATIFQRACKLGLEGIVSKRLSAPYRSGRPGTGSRSRAQTAQRWGGRTTGVGDGNNAPFALVLSLPPGS
jgi:hypothetical protein